MERATAVCYSSRFLLPNSAYLFSNANRFNYAFYGLKKEGENACRSRQQHGARRLPVVDSNGILSGLIDTDIILKVLCQDVGNMLALINTERNIEKTLRS